MAPNYNDIQTTIAVAHEFHRRVSEMATGDHPDFAKAACEKLLSQSASLLKMLDDADLGEGGRIILIGAALYSLECAEVVMLESRHSAEVTECSQ